jgi:hypothetical protein
VARTGDEGVFGRDRRGRLLTHPLVRPPMTPSDITFTARLGEAHGPVALALLYAVAAAGGEWSGRCEDLAAVVGCSLRQLQIVRGALVTAGVLTYTSWQRGKPAVYRTATPPRLASGTDTAGEEAPPLVSVPATRGRKPQPSDPLFDAIVSFAYGGLRPAKSGRVAALAVEMAKAGLDADRFRAEIAVVVGRFAPYRTTLDIDTITKCWRWILSPPATVEKPAGKSPPSAFDLARKATANGNPFRPLDDTE